MTILQEDTQAICGRCFSPMGVFEDDETHERWFECPKCGKIPIPEPGPPKPQNLARSYRVRFGVEE